MKYANPLPPTPMKTATLLLRATLLLLLACFALPIVARADDRKAIAKLEASIVTIETTRKQYDLQQPWTKRPRTTGKSGVVVGPKEILTTAEELQNRLNIRVQKNGSGRWWKADVNWLDYHANVALLTVEDETFWKGLKPVEFAKTMPARDTFMVARWKNGNLESRKVDFNQYSVDDGRLSAAAMIYVEFESEMVGIGGADPLFGEGKLLGLTCSQSENHVRALPSAFLKGVLDRYKSGRWNGLGYFPFYWQITENPDIHAYLQWKGEPRGVMVIMVPAQPPLEDNLKPRDLILQVDGYDIDMQGHYQDPEYGRLMLESLSTRGRFAGDVVPIKVWRDGHEQVVQYRLPRVDYANKLVPDQVFDENPEYLIAGGLVFQPLNKNYLHSWGADWRRSAPFRLNYFDQEYPSPTRPSIVLLSLVLPDAFNLGYQDLRALVVVKVNGVAISTISGLKEALQRPRNGFHEIEFMRGDSLKRLVLDANQLDAATARVLERYNIPVPESIKPTGAVAGK